MKKGYLYVVLTAIIFSTLEIVLKLVDGAFNPVQLTFTRFFIGGFFLVPFTIKSLREKHTSVKADLGYFAFLGFLGIVISMGLYQLAVQTTKASVVAVLFSCNPVFVIILAFFITGEIINKNNILALVLEVIGTLIIINPLNTKLSVLGYHSNNCINTNLCIIWGFRKKNVRKIRRSNNHLLWIYIWKFRTANINCIKP